jgi:uncharacterized membrane protein YgcG
VGLLVAVVALLLAGPALASPAGDARSFSLVSLDTDAVLFPDGSMEVRERVVYDFAGGPFRVGIRSFDPTSRTSIVDFAVTEGGVALDVHPPSETPTGEWEWTFASPARDEVRTFVLTYRVAEALTVGPDVGELYWQFVGDDHPGIGSMTVRLQLPGDAPPATADVADDDASVVRAWGHGPATGKVELRPGEVRAEVPRVPSGQLVELRVLVPTTELSVPPSTGPRLATVLAEERSYLNDADRAETRQRIGDWLAPLAAALGLAGTVGLWLAFGREPEPEILIGDYWREPLDDPPAIVLTSLKRGTVPIDDAIGATLVDLAQRGYLRITAQTTQRWGPDSTDHTIHWQGRDFGDDVLEYERTLVTMVLRGRPQMSLDELTAWGRSHRSAASKELARLRQQITAEYHRRGYRPIARPLARGLVVGLAALTAAAGVVALLLGSGLGWIAVATAPLVGFAGGWLVQNRPPRAATEVAKAQGLRRFLRDFSHLEQAPVGHLILWERYLVYAVTLGVSAELLRGLATRLPALAQDPSFGTWYLGPRGRLDGLEGFGRIGGSISSSFSPPSNTSGAGGGFSGGGGGGGGGGGFGAR